MRRLNNDEYKEIKKIVGEKSTAITNAYLRGQDHLLRRMNRLQALHDKLCDASFMEVY